MSKLKMHTIQEFQPGTKVRLRYVTDESTEEAANGIETWNRLKEYHGDEDFKVLSAHPRDDKYEQESEDFLVKIAPISGTTKPGHRDHYTYLPCLLSIIPTDEVQTDTVDVASLLKGL